MTHTGGLQRRKILSLVVMAGFYGGLSLVLALLVTGTLGSVLPGSIASKVAYNSEAYFFALVVVGWIHLRRTAPQVVYRPIVMAMTCTTLAALGIALLMVDLPSRIATLNEAAFAASIMVFYIWLPRPLPRIVPWAVFLTISGIAALAVAGGGDSWVINQAEALGFIALLPVALDVVDRSILEPTVGTSRRLRYSFYVFLMVEPVVISALGTGRRQGGGADAITLEFLGRIHEAFFGVLLICLFFAVVLDRSGTSIAPRLAHSGSQSR